MTVSIGICSTAHLHYETYARLLDTMADVEFLGIADEDEKRGRTNADVLDCQYRSPDTLLSAADGVIVCSTNTDHPDWINRAAVYGTDVLSEKPLAPTRDTAETAVRTARDAGIQLGVAMPLRFSEPIRRLVEAYEAGEFGSLRAISGTNRGEMPGGWFVNPEAAGGGAIMDHTSHIVDVVTNFTGEPVVEVHAESGTRFHELPVEDINVLSMELADGTQFLLDGSWSRPAEWPTWGGAALDVLGTDGAMAVDCFEQTLDYVGSRGETDTEALFWGVDPNRRLLGDFVAAVRDARAPETTGDQALHVVDVIEAAYRSIDEGTPVAVDADT